MTDTTSTSAVVPHRVDDEAIVWIDHEQAVVVSLAGDRVDAVTRIGRRRGEREGAFEARAVDEVLDRDRVVVAGPAFARTEFEREFVALTKRPDRLVDHDPTASAPHARPA
jgi:hypothetical protein